MKKNAKTPKMTAATAAKLKAAAKSRSERKAAEKAAVALPKMDAETVQQFEAWKNGEALQPMASARGLTYEQLRNRFIKLAGGKPQFFALREAGAGSRAVPIGVAGVSTAMDDSKVPVVTSTKTWVAKFYKRPRTVPVEKVGNVETFEYLAVTFVTPEGEEYIEADSGERADVLVPSALFEGKVIRMKRFAETTRGKRILKEVADRERRTVAEES